MPPAHELPFLVVVFGSSKEIISGPEVQSCVLCFEALKCAAAALPEGGCVAQVHLCACVLMPICSRGAALTMVISVTIMILRCSNRASHAAGEQLDWYCRSGVAPEQGSGAASRTSGYGPGWGFHCALERPCLDQKGTRMASKCLTLATSSA